VDNVETSSCFACPGLRKAINYNISTLFCKFWREIRSMWSLDMFPCSETCNFVVRRSCSTNTGASTCACHLARDHMAHLLLLVIIRGLKSPQNAVLPAAAIIWYLIPSTCYPQRRVSSLLLSSCMSGSELHWVRCIKWPSGGGYSWVSNGSKSASPRYLRLPTLGRLKRSFVSNGDR